MEVRKPGRPLSSCPHPTGSCSCERAVVAYSIPKTSGCACPSDDPPPVLQSNGTGRVQKTRARKSTATNFNPGLLEKAIKAAQDGETDSSSHLTRTPTSESNAASFPSSASSTPRLLPLQKETDSVVVEATVPTSRPVTSQGSSSCCKPKPVQASTGSCCSKKTAPPPQSVPPKKSCCGGSAPVQPVQPVQQQTPLPHIQPNFPQHPPNFTPYPAHFQHPPYAMAHPGSNFMQTPPPLNFNTPIYNHMASGYHPSMSMPMTSVNGHTTRHNSDHNCHCGDSCSCFGCAAHPNNATMIEYMRSMHQFMSTGQFGAMSAPTYDLPTYPHQPGYGAEANLGFNSVSNSYVPANPMNFQTSINTTMSMPHPPMNIASPWSQTPTPSAIQTTPTTTSPFFESNSAPNNLIQQSRREPSISMPIKVEEKLQSPTFTQSPSLPADSPSESRDEDAVTLSPSSYFWQELVLPGCNDETGTCQCGDGCECVGCLTHGGHNGVALEMPESNGRDAFPNFATPTSTANDSSQFMSFATTPG